MKVVLFCGGLGTRLREYSDTIPKPMVNIGYRPILWHLMKYYAHFGHTEFILCLGYKGDVIKKYFLEYDECLSNDFTLSEGGSRVELFRSDIDSWQISFVDTGLHSNIGQRLATIRHLIGDDEMFLANYSDGLSDLDLVPYVRTFSRSGKVASFLAVHPSQTFHVVDMDRQGEVRRILHSHDAGLWVNGGYFVFRREIFDYMRPGEELVVEPFERLIAKRKLMVQKYEGFWACMDTFKDKQQFDDRYAAGDCPWALWNSSGLSPHSTANLKPAERTASPNLTRPRRRKS